MRVSFSLPKLVVVFTTRALLVLAVQNMAARPIAKDHEVEFSALEGSLSMMSKVLNDVLDLCVARLVFFVVRGDPS